MSAGATDLQLVSKEDWSGGQGQRSVGKCFPGVGISCKCGGTGLSTVLTGEGKKTRQ